MKGIHLVENMWETQVKYKDEEGWIFTICSFIEGKPLQIHAGLPNNIGIPVDKNGCIMVRRTHDSL